MRLSELPQAVLDKLDILNLEKLRTNRFAVQIDDTRQDAASGRRRLTVPRYGASVILGFEKVEGLHGQIEIREVREAGFKGMHRFPRRSRHPALRLVRGLAVSRSLWDWFCEVRDWTKGEPDYRRSLSIFMLDSIATPGGLVDYEVWRWDIYDAWPSEWHGPVLDAVSNSMAVEGVTIQHSGISPAQGLLSGTAGEVLNVFS